MVQTEKDAILEKIGSIFKSNKAHDWIEVDFEGWSTKNNDGSYDLTVTIPEEEWVYGYILSFGNHAEVLEPEHIREGIKTRAKEILEKY